MPLDPYRVGEVLMNWAASSAQLGHKSPQNSVVYMHPASPEGQFVLAMMDDEPTSSILARWPEVMNVHRPQMPIQGRKRRRREPGFGRLERS